MANIDDIKRLTLRALMADDILMQGLVLKGGNALQLAYDIINRGSIDIDFSMEREFSEKDFDRLTRVFGELLNNEFAQIGLVAYDVKFIQKPKSGSIPEWKGYMLEFKLIEKEKFDQFGEDIGAIRRNSIKVNDQSTRYTVDISSYEYVDGAVNKDIDGLILRVYTPEMILIEKVRALCQTMDKYKDIVNSARPKERARDLYDIWMITQHFAQLNLTDDLFRNIFGAKRVPLSFLKDFEDLRERNRANWDVVKQTINSDQELQDYDYYFDFVKDLINPFKDLSDNTASIGPKAP
ncbi:nucleotidyl transferase AbiEii/AbiGii toxin family protein [Bacteroides acidifaciens]|jgi:predicted nucleotidyltransferase component of viral defense system|uniref:nucleotidyl transferase AbiEii/AbiGii toxin family protein n=1 Tax=Bacteroides acidifaciens TaxID=85831 RepID=UPI00158D7112|nr:nucleotidyl transferase AbiEii/AbiGii toxin family protein [Bacteroides acidifaciens]